MLVGANTKAIGCRTFVVGSTVTSPEIFVVSGRELGCLGPVIARQVCITYLSKDEGALAVFPEGKTKLTRSH